MSFKNSLSGFHRFLLAALVITSLQACASFGGSEADSIADSGNLHYEQIGSEPFLLTTYAHIRDINAPLTIYIEGDIQGWWPPVDPGWDPTPDSYLGLRLASVDPSANVAYIARPCQFSTEDDTACDPAAWASGRYAELIVSSMNRAVDHFAVSFTHPRINLVGYSGGAAIAAILAARRHDVVSLRTIAGNLDPAGAARYHADDGNTDFVDPMRIAPRLSHLAQTHYVGGKDTTVPPFLTANFIQAVGSDYCITEINVPNATHLTGWVEFWKTNAAQIPLCGKANSYY